MSIDYQILWVDDAPDWVESIQDPIKSHLEEKGYDPKIELKQSVADVATDRLTHIDLIIIDYQLPGDNGDELIKQIRNKEYLTEIVFYSEGTLPSTGHVNGVYISPRNEVEELIKRVIDETIKKAQDITLVRGFIIAEAIDVENILEECMTKVFGDKGELFSEKVISAKPPVYSANEKYKFVHEIVRGLIGLPGQENGRLTELKGIDDIMNKLAKEVFDQRNILAHSKKKINDDGSTTLEGINRETREIRFDQEWLSLARKNISKHKENLNKLKEILD